MPGFILHFIVADSKVELGKHARPAAHNKSDRPGAWRRLASICSDDFPARGAMPNAAGTRFPTFRFTVDV
jgi:hypothetical protein